MPVPSEYQRATLDFYQFLTDARDAAGLTTTNQAMSRACAVCLPSQEVNERAMAIISTLVRFRAKIGAALFRELFQERADGFYVAVCVHDCSPCP
jgi:hypothetical protein